MFRHRLVHRLLGPWGVVIAVKLRLLPARALEADFGSVSRLVQFRALLGLRKRHLSDTWVIERVRRLLYSEYGVIRAQAARRLLESEPATSATSSSIEELWNRELQDDSVLPSVSNALVHGATRKLPAMTQLIAPILKALATKRSRAPAAEYALRNAASTTFSWAKSLPSYPLDRARDELPSLIQILAAPEPIGGERGWWFESVIAPFATLLIRSLAEDPHSRASLIAQRDELTLVVFQHSPHPRMKLIAPVLNELSRLGGDGSG